MNVPTETRSVPRITMPVKYSEIMPMLQHRSITEPKASFKRTAWIKESRCSSVSCRKVFLVSSSAVKLWMMRMPERSSCTKAFRLEDFSGAPASAYGNTPG